MSVGLGDVGVILRGIAVAVLAAALTLAVAERVLRLFELLLGLALAPQPLLGVALLERVGRLACRLLGVLQCLERGWRQRLLIATLLGDVAGLLGELALGVALLFELGARALRGLLAHLVELVLRPLQLGLEVAT